MLLYHKTRQIYVYDQKNTALQENTLYLVIQFNFH
jgi:hypothetical protein